MEKRKTPRVGPYVTPCKIATDDGRTSGYLLDLSQRGAQISSGAAPPGPGSAVTLEVKLGAAVSSKIRAVIRWVQPPFDGPGGMYHFGVGFEDVDADTRKLLDAILEDFRRRAADLA
jgi:hypothetical protein